MEFDIEMAGVCVSLTTQYKSYTLNVWLSIQNHARIHSKINDSVMLHRLLI